MPAGSSPLAITAVQMAFSVKAEITKSLKEGEAVLTNDDEFEVGDAYDPTFEISAEGNGDAPDGIAAAVEGLDDVTGISGGKTMIDQFSARQNHDKRNSWTMHAMNFPAAT